MKHVRVQAVFFDAGGTLLHPHPSVGEIYANVARDFGLRVAADRMERAFRIAWVECHRAEPAGQASSRTAISWWRHVVFKTLDVLGEDVTDREAYFLELYELFARPDVWRLYPETEEVLAELSQRGYKLGLISNWDQRLRPLLEQLDIARHFQAMTISCEVGAEKPAAEIFHRALQETSVDPNAALHVGDSFRDDVVGAKQVGIHAVLIQRDGTEEHHRVPTIRSLRELLSVVPF
jgi:putative hydrolase of the HAD superfamily